MWECRKCGKPVYFAERKQSLGFDWHPNCLRCEECGKRLNPGQHAEHKGVPYCHHPCYGALFGPHLFGHGTRNECHTSFGKVENRNGQLKRSHLETRLKVYNQFYDGRSGELKSREVNGRLVLEGVLRIYWGVHNVIHLKEEDDQRMIATGFSNENNVFADSDPEDEGNFFHDLSLSEEKDQWDIYDRPSSLPPSLRTVVYNTTPANFYDGKILQCLKDTELLSPDFTKKVCLKQGSTVIKRQPGRRMEKCKLKRRCSINGHFYLRETSSFTPPFGCYCSVWITSLVTTGEVLNMVLDKYKIEMSAKNFALFVVKDSGEQRLIKDDGYPLVSRVMLGPHEDVAKIFIMDVQNTQEISPQVAQFLNFTLAECRAILNKYEQEEQRNIKLTRQKYEGIKYFIQRRMAELNPCLKDEDAKTEAL